MRFSALLALSLLVLVQSCFSAQPNVLIVLVDDMGFSDLGCYGSEIATPNMDKLAANGVRFTQFYNTAKCHSSRVSLLSGRWCRQAGDESLKNAVILPEVLAPAGYFTSMTGKWHLSNAQTEGAPKPDAYGYDEASVFNGGAGWESADLHATASNAVAFIKANKTQPFFINAWIHESHTPHVPTAESMAKWKHLDEQKQVYAAVITDGDNAVGAILDALKTEGLEDNTIVMFSSDNGPESTASKRLTNKFDPDANVTGYDTFYSVGETGRMGSPGRREIGHGRLAKRGIQAVMPLRALTSQNSPLPTTPREVR